MSSEIHEDHVAIDAALFRQYYLLGHEVKFVWRIVRNKEGK
jgi:hypothetical protein